MTSIRAETLIKAPIETCFSVSLNIDLETQAGAEYGLRPIGGRVSGVIGYGERVMWRTRQFGLSVRHTSEITGYKSPEFFEDSMVEGLFRQFRHQHFFKVLGPEQTLMNDILTFSMPLRFAGVFSEKLFVQQRLVKLLSKRNRLICSQAESQKNL